MWGIQPVGKKSRSLLWVLHKPLGENSPASKEAMRIINRLRGTCARKSEEMKRAAEAALNSHPIRFST
jgi:hypothetical protein